jgi:hypothetical protein
MFVVWFTVYLYGGWFINGRLWVVQWLDLNSGILFVGAWLLLGLRQFGYLAIYWSFLCRQHLCLVHRLIICCMVIVIVWLVTCLLASLPGLLTELMAFVRNSCN